jgi:thiamine-phosphate pyrophosphorylase
MTGDVKILRLIDANLNRAREGLRVVEDAFRFLDDNPQAQVELKRMRHSLLRYESLVDPSGEELLRNRASDEDIGAFVNPASEMHRPDTISVIRSNLKRVQESLRCLEEYGKLIDAQAAGIAKRLRFDAYGFEKRYGLASSEMDNTEACEEGDHEDKEG